MTWNLQLTKPNKKQHVPLKNGKHFDDSFVLVELRGICDALGDLIPLAQFKKCEKHLWSSVIFSKVAGFSLYLY